MIASDCSSDESSQPKNNEFSEQASFPSSGFLESIKTRQLSSDSSNHSKSALNCSKQFSDSVYDIYEQNDAAALFQGKLVFQLTESIESRPKKSIQYDKHAVLLEARTNVDSVDYQEEALSHLIMDIDDINKQSVLKHYKKLEDREAKAFRKKADENNLVLEMKGNT